MINLKNNGLLISDWHIKKDERFSPTLDYRLKEQPMMLLDRVEELIPELNIGWIALPGDLVDTSSCLPQENHVLKDCFERMNKWNLPVLYILGQHDVDLNLYSNEEFNYYDRSNVTVLAEEFNNIIYAHDKTALLNDKYKVYFSNYSNPPKYPKEYCDLWITHFSLGFVDVEEEDKDGNRKFGIMVAGDIHEHLQYGNCYTVGTPYQHKAHEQPVGVVGIVEVNDDGLSFYRKKTDTEKRKFLRFLPPEKKKLKSTDNDGNEIMIDIVKDFNVVDELFKKVKECGLEYIHNKIDKAGAPNPINFNFKIRRLKLKNYRSVSELDLDFDNIGKVLWLVGSNGAGKSTIIYALRDAFFGNTATISKQINFNSKSCEIELTLDYEGKQYKIVRGKSIFKFFINDVEQASNNKKALETMMNDCLPFIEYMYLFLPPQKTSLFNSQIGIELIEKCLNLELFNYYLDQAVKLKKIYSEEANVVNKKITIKDGEMNVYETERASLLNVINEYKKVVKKNKDELALLKNKYIGYKERIDSLTTTIKIAESNLEKYKIESDDTKESIAVKIKELEQQKLIYEEYKEKLMVKLNLINERKSLQEEYKRLSSLLKTVPDLPNESLGELKQQLLDIDSKNEEIYKERSYYDLKIKEYKEKELQLEDSIKNGNYVCKECGTLIQKDISEFEKELKNTRKLQNELVKPRDLLDSTGLLNKIKIWEDNLFNEELNKSIQDVITKGKDCNNRIKEFENYTEENCPKAISDIDIAPYRTTLGLFDRYDYEKNVLEISKKDLNDLLERINKELGEGNTLNSVMKQIDDQLLDANMLEGYERDLVYKIERMKIVYEEREALIQEFETKKKELSDWDTYIALMDYNQLDSLPFKIIDTLLSNFNNDNYRITTTYTQKNAKIKFKIDLQLKDSTDSHWISYENASGGQQMLLELFLFGSVATYIGGVGLIGLDETLGVASMDVYAKIDDLISLMEYNNIIIISHSERLSCYNSRIVVKLENGYSQYKLV